MVPTPESIDLETSLQVPVRIIKSLQSFTQVMIDPLPDLETMCKFIITDEHWLHDNVLALLRYGPDLTANSNPNPNPNPLLRYKPDP